MRQDLYSNIPVELFPADSKFILFVFVAGASRVARAAPVHETKQERTKFTTDGVRSVLRCGPMEVQRPSLSSLSATPSPPKAPAKTPPRPHQIPHPPLCAQIHAQIHAQTPEAHVVHAPGLNRRKNSPALPLLDPTEPPPTPSRLANPPPTPPHQHQPARHPPPHGSAPQFRRSAVPAPAPQTQKLAGAAPTGPH